jgi:acyl-homoserine lactone acylase PvdQ
MMTSDFFYEEFDDNGKVKYKGEWVEVKWRKELIKVKNDVDVEIDYSNNSPW